MESNSPNRFVISTEAQYDLEDIYVYTLFRFGIDQADSYILSFDSILERIASKPDLGKQGEGYLSDLFAYHHQSHVIFYDITKYGIRVQRILHHVRDFKRHL